MKSIWILLSFSLLILSCAHKEKEIIITETPPPTETIPVAPPAAIMGPINVSLHGYKQLRAQGMLHLTQDKDTVHVEVMLEGMKPGPYKLNVSDSKKCKNAKATKGRDLGEVVADGKGTVRASFDLDTLQPSDLIGKKVIVYTMEKKKTKVAACGVPEKMDSPN
jgi:hypothetical protein